MKKLMALALMLGLLCTNAYALEQAGGSPDWSRLERYSSFVQQETVWSVRSNQTEAALSRMAMSEPPHNGYVCFGMELTGDRETSVTVPVLAFYYCGAEELNAGAVSVAVDGVRYDLAVYSETVKIGRMEVERLSAALDTEGMKMVRAMLQAECVQAALLGDEIIEVEAEHKESYRNTRDELAGRSLQAVESMLREFEAVEPYALWDLNGAWWTRSFGVKPQMQTACLSEEMQTGEITLEGPMYMLWRGHYGKDVRELQQLLIDNGYIQGRIDGVYGDNTVRAVQAAQRWWGLLPTGCADEALIALLRGDRVDSAPAAGAADEAAVHTAQGVCELSVSRFWFADAVESTGGDRRSVLDRDDTMIIYDGMVRNLSRANLDFYWQISAVVRCGEYEYPCVTACERNGGMSLSSTLPPLGQARLLIYAEIPDTVAGMDGWTLEVSAGDSTFVFE